MSSEDTSLYGIQRQRKLTGKKEISSSTSLSFTSQLSSLINNSSSSSSQPKPKTTSQRLKPKKDDLFHAPARNMAKRAKRDREPDASSRGAFEQKHTTAGETLDGQIWERSKRKMEEKARLYAAMKRGDVEDVDEKYAVDFDRKWAEAEEAGGSGGASGSDLDEDDEDRELVEYLDEFGRTRTGTRAEAGRAERIKRGQRDLEGDRFTARPMAPANVIYGDAIQHQAFDPDAPIAAQMEALAAKRDKSLTPPPEEHFDARREVRSKGTGFFQFSADKEERKRQMEGLERERAETERRRREKLEEITGRRSVAEEQAEGAGQVGGKRKADDFLDSLAEELTGKLDPMQEAEMLRNIKRAVEREVDSETTGHE